MKMSARFAFRNEGSERGKQKTNQMLFTNENECNLSQCRFVGRNECKKEIIISCWFLFRPNNGIKTKNKKTKNKNCNKAMSVRTQKIFHSPREMDITYKCVECPTAYSAILRQADQQQKLTRLISLIKSPFFFSNIFSPIPLSTSAFSISFISFNRLFCFLIFFL